MIEKSYKNTEGYDLIGDIHGHADELRRLLATLGYTESLRGFRHPKRKAIFVGDFIDRGPQQIETVNIARQMIEQGSALAVMGNHEYNAVCYATPDPKSAGHYLRPHTEKNTKQHREFLAEVSFGSSDHEEMVNWFRSLPIYLDLGELRIVHACWHDEMIAALTPWLDDTNCLLRAGYEESSVEGTVAHSAIEVVLKGIERQLPEGQTFTDKDGHTRSEVRLQWWADHDGTLREAAIMDDTTRQALPEIKLTPPHDYRYNSACPVFFGHYWLTGRPSLTSEIAACLDFSVAKNGVLCAYRWSRESHLDENLLVWV